MSEFLSDARLLSAAEFDHRLETAVREHERAEKLICFYLNQINRRKLYESFGFENVYVYDYALERFGYCRSKTRALLYLGRRLSQLPALTEALATGRLGWTKAAKVASVASPETDAEMDGEGGGVLLAVPVPGLYGAGGPARASHRIPGSFRGKRASARGTTRRIS